MKSSLLIFVYLLMLPCSLFARQIPEASSGQVVFAIKQGELIEHGSVGILMKLSPVTSRFYGRTDFLVICDKVAVQFLLGSWKMKDNAYISDIRFNNLPKDARCEIFIEGVNQLFFLTEK